MIPGYIRRTINAWVAWRARRGLRKAVPALVALDMARAEKAHRHLSGTRAIDAEKQRLVTERLQFELGWSADG